MTTLNIDVEKIAKGDFHLPDGTIEQRVFMEDDIVVTKDILDEMIKLGSL